MIINHNMMAMNTDRQMGSVSKAQAKSMEKLASGLRINRAGDDAAGLAISEKMRGQIRGLNQASRNAQDGISLIQTAEGALNETHDILQRMRELAVQATNDTNTASDRGQISKEIDQLTDEIDRISGSTEFNKQKLLNGNLANTTSVSATNVFKLSDVQAADFTGDAGIYKISGATSLTAAVRTEKNYIDAGTNITSAKIAITAGTLADVEFGHYKVTVADDTVNVGTKKITLENTTTGETFVQSNVVTASNYTLNGINISTAITANNGTAEFDIGISTATFTLYDSTNTKLGSTTLTNHYNSTVQIQGLELELKGDLVGKGTTSFTVASNSLSFQIGANENQTMSLSISDMGSDSLGVDKTSIDVSSSANAGTAITTIDSALESVSDMRSRLGAVQNRLDHTIRNLDTSGENLQSSESRIRDVDMAKEMMNYTKQNILSQASQAMLAQANQAPQGVLSLLR